MFFYLNKFWKDKGGSQGANLVPQAGMKLRAGSVQWWRHYWNSKCGQCPPPSDGKISICKACPCRSQNFLLESITRGLFLACFWLGIQYSSSNKKPTPLPRLSWRPSPKPDFMEPTLSTMGNRTEVVDFCPPCQDQWNVWNLHTFSPEGNLHKCFHVPTKPQAKIPTD